MFSNKSIYKCNNSFWKPQHNSISSEKSEVEGFQWMFTVFMQVDAFKYVAGLGIIKFISFNIFNPCSRSIVKVWRF